MTTFEMVNKIFILCINKPLNKLISIKLYNQWYSIIPNIFIDNNIINIDYSYINPLKDKEYIFGVIS